MRPPRPRRRRLTPYERAWLGVAIVLAWAGVPVWHGLAWLTDRRRWWRHG